MPLVNLKAAILNVNADAGDEHVLPFSVVATDTTAWVVTADLYLANNDHNGPTGEVLVSATVENAPNTEGGNSLVTATFEEGDTDEYLGQVLWIKVVKTSSPRRTLAKGTFNL